MFSGHSLRVGTIIFLSLKWTKLKLFVVSLYIMSTCLRNDPPTPSLPASNLSFDGLEVEGLWEILHGLWEILQWFLSSKTNDFNPTIIPMLHLCYFFLPRKKKKRGNKLPYPQKKRGGGGQMVNFYLFNYIFGR